MPKKKVKNHGGQLELLPPEFYVENREEPPFDVLTFLPDIEVISKQNILPNIVPEPNDWTVEALSKKEGMSWLSECDFTLLYPESVDIKCQQEELKEFMDVLSSECVSISSEFCSTFPKDYNEKLLGFDTETTGLDTRIQYDRNGNLIVRTELVGLCLSTSTTKGYYLPVRHTEDDGILNWDSELINHFIDYLQQNYTLLIHNAAYDREIIGVNGCTKPRPYPYFFDTMILSFQEEPHSKQMGLEALSLKHLNRKMMSTKELFSSGDEKSKNDYHDSVKINFKRLPATHAFVYGCQDAVNTYMLFQRIASNPQNVFITQPVPVMVDHKMSDFTRSMYRSGLPINLRYAINTLKDCIWRIQTIEDDIFQSLGKEADLDKRTILNEIIFDELKIPKDLKNLQKNKDGSISLDEGTLDLLHEDYPEVKLLELLVTYRKLNNLATKFMKKFITNSYVCYFMPWTHVQLQFQLTTAETGRLASRSNDGAPEQLLINKTKAGRYSYKFIRKSGDCGFNSQGINSDPFINLPGKKVKKLPPEAGINVDNPYDNSLNEKFIFKVGVAKVAK